MEKDLKSIENKIAQEILMETERNLNIDSGSIDQLIVSKINKSKLFTEEWQAHYAKERILKELLKLKYGEKATDYEDVGIKKPSAMINFIIALCPAILFTLIWWTLVGSIFRNANESLGDYNLITDSFIGNILILSCLILPIVALYFFMRQVGIYRRKRNLNNAHPIEGKCPHCHVELIFEPADFKTDSVVCPTCSKKFSLK